jgi:hypothetical protein
MGKVRLAALLFLLCIPALRVQSAPPARRPRVIVFVHGLHGNRETWRAANGAYWPDMVRADPRFAFSDVDVAEYPTPASNGSWWSYL